MKAEGFLKSSLKTKRLATAVPGKEQKAQAARE